MTSISIYFSVSLFTDSKFMIFVKRKILFWLDQNLMMYVLSYHLQKKIDADFYGIYDFPNKTRKFFEKQKLVNFQKTWYYHDQINFKKNEIDIEYLSNFEKKYGIGLWNLAVNERLFYRLTNFINLLRKKYCRYLNKNVNHLKVFLMRLNLIFSYTENHFFIRMKFFIKYVDLKELKF